MLAFFPPAQFVAMPSGSLESEQGSVTLLLLLIIFPVLATEILIHEIGIQNYISLEVFCITCKKKKRKI